MRALLVALLMTVASFAAASAQDTSTPNAAAETCIRENVERVERAVESLAEATTFLTEKLCASAVADSVRAMQQARLQAGRERMEQMCAEGEVGGGLIGALSGYDPCDEEGFWAEEEVMITAEGYDMATAYLINQISPDVISLAASLLLEARLARLGSSAE